MLKIANNILKNTLRRKIGFDLKCFQGDMVEVTDDEFVYCVLTPERFDGNDYIKAHAFGMKPESDSTKVYDNIFGLNRDTYKILSMCIFEVTIISYPFYTISTITEIRLWKDSSSIVVQKARIHVALFLQLRSLQPEIDLFRLHRELESLSIEYLSGITCYRHGLKRITDLKSLLLNLLVLLENLFFG